MDATPIGRAAVLATACASFFNTGLQWYTQATTYPLFHALPGDGFVPYHKAYERTLPRAIYAPYALLMVGNLLLLARPPRGVGRGRALAMLALNGSIMAESLALAAPIHARLDRKGKNDRAIDRLVRLNALRLAAFAASSTLALGALMGAVGPVARQGSAPRE